MRAGEMRTTQLQEKKIFVVLFLAVILERLAETAGNCLRSGE